MLKQLSHLIFIPFLCTLLFACGGGGGGGGAPAGDDGSGGGGGNTVPIADAGANQTIKLGSGSISLDGSASSDADGDVFTFLWEFLEVPTGSTASLDYTDTATTSFTPDVSGTYRVQLTINDGTASSSNVVVVTIDNNTPPVANAGENQRFIFGMGAVSLEGSGSNDAEGDPLTYLWEFTQVPTGSTITLTNSATASSGFTPDITGMYRVRLTVNDGLLSHSVIVDIDVASNTNPVANAGEFIEAVMGAAVQLDGRASLDPDGQALTYTWAQLRSTCPDVTGGAGTLIGVQPVFTAPNKVCTLLFDLRVNDGLGDSFADRVSVFIAEGQQRIFVSLANGYDSNNGSRLAPLQNIQTAINLAETQGNGADIYVTEGVYNTYLILKDRISLYGGYDQNWERDIGNNISYLNTGSFPVRGDSVTNLTFDGFTAMRPNSTTTGYGLHLSNTDNIQITNNIFSVGSAGDGQNGAAGSNGSAGPEGGNGYAGSCDGAGGAGGAGGGRSFKDRNFAGYRGGYGGGGREGLYGTGGYDGSGPDAGRGGSRGEAGNPGRSGYNGGRGGDGVNGANGAAPALIGIFYSSGYGHRTGTAGVDGKNGSGGGGGGAGGGQTGTWVNDGGGNGGGGGGAGGLGGTGGQPGTSGYSSFALYLYNVTNSTVANNTITAGRGGNGGNGGAGGSGGARGLGGTGRSECTTEVGRGGNGGAGGNGGNGGRGAGGVGGFSVGIAYSNDSSITFDANIITVGTPSSGGAPNGPDGISQKLYEFTP